MGVKRTCGLPCIDKEGEKGGRTIRGAFISRLLTIAEMAWAAETWSTSLDHKVKKPLLSSDGLLAMILLVWPFIPHCGWRDDAPSEGQQKLH